MKTNTGLPLWIAQKTGPNNTWRIDLVVTAAALLLAGIVLIVAEFVILRSSLLGELKIQMQIIGDNSGAALMFNDHAAADEILDTLQASPSVDVAILYTP
ncbi:MAG: CHASE sensor domain-containing protein, partial [Methylophilaceae bacterium]